MIKHFYLQFQIFIDVTFWSLATIILFLRCLFRVNGLAAVKTKRVKEKKTTSQKNAKLVCSLSSSAVGENWTATSSLQSLTTGIPRWQSFETAGVLAKIRNWKSRQKGGSACRCCWTANDFNSSRIVCTRRESPETSGKEKYKPINEA